MGKMERMEQKIDQIQGSERREELVAWLMDLMDEEYQNRTWIAPKNNISLYQKMSYPFELIFDEFGINEKRPQTAYDKIGYVFKSKKEADVIHKLSKVFLPLHFHCHTNEEYLASPYLPKLRKASKEAFDIFMANEKDNKEFLEQIERIKKEQHRTW